MKASKFSEAQIASARSSAPLLEALEAWLRSSGAAYRARPRSPSRSTTCSSDGIGRALHQGRQDLA
jgi:hypothetical protein